MERRDDKIQPILFWTVWFKKKKSYETFLLEVTWYQLQLSGKLISSNVPKNCTRYIYTVLNLLSFSAIVAHLTSFLKTFSNTKTCNQVS